MSRSWTVVGRTIALHALGLALVSSAFGCSSSRVECRPIDDGNPCTEDLCVDGAPVHEPVSAGAVCDVDGGAVCDGEGACVACVATSDCADGLVCNASNQCVPATCADGMTNGEETDEDCGGSECPACAPGARCEQPSDCEDGVCEGGVCVAAACGDGVTNGTEECDDGGTTDGDGCSAECVLEECGDGVVNGSAEECDDGNDQDGDGCSATCVVEVCGDGTVNNGEECDDGGTTDGDGCTAECVAEVCGDGSVNDAGAEECDDGNLDDGDGCSAACVVEYCGDGTVNNGEECDDGGTTDGDGCTAECVAEVCGDGVVNGGGGEECDDGGTTDGDGCGATCLVEFCGDGIVNDLGSEECDDGGTADDNGCTAGCELDDDDDGLSNNWDPFPDDPTLPGRALPNVIYAHTANRLYTVSPTDYGVTEIGVFSFDQSSGSVTDIAVNRRGVVFAVTFDDLFVCNPATAACYYLADLPQSFNGLTMVPPGTLHPSEDTLVGIANSGTWYAISTVGTTAMLTEIGSYGGGQSNAGDVVSIQGVGTYGAVHKPGVTGGNVIVECDPLTGTVLRDVATATGFTTIYGIAATADRVFAFNSGGQIIEIDPALGTFTVVASTSYAWWGAGALTVLAH